MKEPHGEGLVSHPDPASCVDGREAGGEALTGAHTGRPLSCEISWFGMSTPFSEAEGNMAVGVIGEPTADPAPSKTPYMCENSSFGNREIPTTSSGDGPLDRPAKVNDRTAGMHLGGKSEGCIVPMKLPNNDRRSAEAAEGRRPATGNVAKEVASRTPSREIASTELAHVRDVASKDKQVQFTAPLHHVTVPVLLDSFFALKRLAAPRVDGAARRWTSASCPGVSIMRFDMRRLLTKGVGAIFRWRFKPIPKQQFTTYFSAACSFPLVDRNPPATWPRRPSSCGLLGVPTPVLSFLVPVLRQVLLADRLTP
jgi:hypothetical protein